MNKRIRGNKLIYDKIKELCKARGSSVAQVERNAGLSNGAISKWNDVSPTVANLQAVAKVLNCSIDDLLDDTAQEGG